MAQIPVLGLVAALALGLVSLALLARVPPRDAPDGASWLPITLLLYNLWVAGFLAEHVWAPPPLAGAPRSGAWTLPLLVLSLAWLYAHIAQIQAFVGARPLWGIRAARYTLAGLAGVLVTGWVLSEWSGHPRIVIGVGAAVAAAVFPAALAASVFFLVRARRLGDASWRARLSALAAAYVGLFMALCALSVGWSRLGRVSPQLPIVLDVALELLYNVVAIAWVLGLAVAPGQAPRAGLAPSAVPAPDATRLFAEHGITRREAEIIQLICLGKTNQEIADQLFISLTTVKDHNYVAFQKLGVRNRTELTRLVLGAAQARPK